jgi:hypothetical protein
MEKGTKERMQKPIHIKKSHEGMLHKDMGIAEGKKIPEASLEKKKASAKKSGDVAELKRVVFAENAKKWHH